LRRSGRREGGREGGREEASILEMFEALMAVE